MKIAVIASLPWWLSLLNFASSFQSSTSRSTALSASSISAASNNVEHNNQSLPLESLSVCIVGAGPSGLLAAHRLAQAGASVRVLEARPRFTDTFQSAAITSNSTRQGRVYALGIGRRGRSSIQTANLQLWSALKQQGFGSERFDLYLPFGIKLRLRKEGDGQRQDDQQQEPSLLMFQNDLCRTLVDELEKEYPPSSSRVLVLFNERIQTIDLTAQELTTSNGESIAYDVILGCDGVNSVVRQAMKETWPEFDCVRERIPGHYKVARLDRIPPKLDSTAVSLLLPKSGSVTAFVEPTKQGSCCILFAGNNVTDPLLSSTNATQLQELIEVRWPKFQGADLGQAAQQLAVATNTSTASLIQCNTFSYSHKAVLLGDAAHATGGVSGQGVNSALVDASVLVDMLVKLYDPDNVSASVRNALLEYSIQQVPEAKALYDLSFGPKPTTRLSRLSLGLRALRDFIVKGRFGIGQLPLQTQLTTSLDPFRQIRRQRDGDYPDAFPSDDYWRETLTTLDATVP
jgi:kynurenine 3-monooxygenase